MNVIYKDREIEGERIELVGGDEVFFLGPNLTLRKCELVIRVPARPLHIFKASLIDCTINIKQKLVGFSWVQASLKGCRFTGWMIGSDFGYFPGYGLGREQGYIEDCDFTGASLESCRFHCCPVETLKFPPWPCFTILDPIGRCEELKSVEWPGKFGPVIIDTLAAEPYTTVAVTHHAPTVAKEMKTTPEALRAAIEKFDFIVY